jgi:signal transduction histidine kinase
MIPILDILPVLSVYPYALLYYAILLASAGLALFAFRRANPTNNPALRNSLLVIFFSQLILLTLSLMIYQGFSQLSLVFPIAFRALTLVCILWFLKALFWQPQERHGWLIWVLTVLILTAASLLALFWLPLAGEQSFNGSWQDFIWVGLTLLTITIGAIVYLLQDRADRAEGILILVLAAMGYLFYLALPNDGNLPASVMVSQLLYYPLLISLAWQRKKLVPLAQPATAERRELSSEVAARMLDVSLQQTNTQIQRSLTHSLGLHLLADLCGFLVTDKENNNLTLLSVYDLIREEFLGTVELPNKDFPVLTAHLEDREILVSNTPKEHAQEKNALMELIGYNQIGNLLFYPLNPVDAPVGRGLLCLSPFTGRAWSPKELDQLSVIAPKVNEILDESADIEQKATSAQRLQTLFNRVQRERAQTEEQFVQSQNLLAQLRQEVHVTGQTHESEVEMWLTRQETLEDQLEDLQNTLQQNEATIAQAEALRLEKERLEHSMAQNTQQMEGLRNALDQARNMLEQMSPQSAVGAKDRPALGLTDELQALFDSINSKTDQKQICICIENTLSAEPSPENKSHLLQLSRSLLQNALSASKAGSEILLEVLPSQDNPGYVELRVSDAGPGLSPEDQTKFLGNLNSGAESAGQNRGEVGALREAVDLTASLGGHWWIHSVPDTLTIHRLAIPLNSGPDTTGNNLATTSQEK